MIGSIIVRSNPVTQWETYLANIVPEGSGYAELEYTDYQVEDRADGGLWTCTFKVYGRPTLLKELFENGLGRQMESWGDGLQQDFEGMIFEMVYNLPPDSYSINLDNMANKMFMRTDYNADGSVDRTTTLTNADSEARYGIKEQILSGGQTTSLTVADQAVQAYVDLVGTPQPEVSIGGASGDDEHLEVFCRGYIETLNWRTYNQTSSTGNQGSSAEAADVVTAAGQFVARQTIKPNATSVTKVYDADRRAFDILESNARLGDSSNNRWIVYMKGRTATQAIGREFVFEQASPAVAQ